MVLLKAQPTLIAKSIGSVVLTSWEPQPTVQYYCAMSQLTFLCASVEVDGSFRSAMKAIVVAASSDGGSEKERVKAEGSVRGLMSAFVQAMIPPGAFPVSLPRQTRPTLPYLTLPHLILSTLLIQLNLLDNLFSNHSK